MQGVSEGLASLHKGGIRPQTLIIDDGWQMTQVDEDYEGKIMLINMHSICDCIFMVTRFPVVALGISSLPNYFDAVWPQCPTVPRSARWCQCLATLMLKLATAVAV